MARFTYILDQPYDFVDCKLDVVTEKDLQQAIYKVKRERLKVKDNEIWSDFCLKDIQEKIPLSETTSIYSKDFSYRKLSSYNIEDFLYGLSQQDIENYILGNNKTPVNFTKNEDNKPQTKCVPNEKKKLTFSNVTSVSVPSSKTKIVENNEYKLLENKLYLLIIQIKHMLEMIRSNKDDFHIPEYPSDGIKLLKKAVEFCVRFSRNYLYQTELQFKSIVKLCSESNISTKLKNLSLIQSLVKHYQILLQAYTVVQRHMHIIWGYDGVARKLNDVLNITIETNHICMSLSSIMETSYFEELQNACKSVAKDIESLLNFKYPPVRDEKMKKKYIFSVNRFSYKMTDEVKNKKSHSKKTKNQPNDNVKRNIHSAPTYNQYYMYNEKPQNKFDMYCKHCIQELNDVKKIKKPMEKSPYSANMASSTRIGQAYYHGKCLNNRSFSFSPNISKSKSKQNQKKDIKIEVVSQSSKNNENMKQLFTEINSNNVSLHKKLSSSSMNNVNNINKDESPPTTVNDQNRKEC